MRVGLIVTAREDSTRLPRKHLQPLDGRRTLLEVMLSRLHRSNAEEYILATTPRSAATACLADALKWQVYSDETTRDQNVLGRVLGAAGRFNLDVVAFVPGDQPLMDAALVDEAVEKLSEGWEYVEHLGDGFSVRVFQTELLRRLVDYILSAQEHVTTAFLSPWQERHIILQHGIIGKYSVDTLEDLQRVRSLVDKIGPDAGWREYTS